MLTMAIVSPARSAFLITFPFIISKGTPRKAFDAGDGGSASVLNCNDGIVILR